MGWTWETAGSDWGVELDGSVGVLRWWGADKPRPGVPAYAQSGGGRDQPVAEFLATGASPYECPPPILAQVRAAAEAWVARASATPRASPPLPAPPPAPAPPPPAPPASADAGRPLALRTASLASNEEVLALLCAAAARLGVQGLHETPVRRKIAEHVHEPDRPHQTAEEETEWEIDLGGGVRFHLRDRWSSLWSCDDFAGAGPVSITILFQSLVVSASPRVREALVAIRGT